MLVPQLTERLRDAENESMAKIAELEKQLSQARKELETLRVRVYLHLINLKVGEGSSLSKGNFEFQGLKARIVLSSSNSQKVSVAVVE